LSIFVDCLYALPLYSLFRASRIAPEAHSECVVRIKTKISLRVPSPIRFPPNPFHRWGRMPSYRPRRASQPISGGLRRRGLCDYRFPSAATLLPIPPPCQAFLWPFLWPAFAPRSPQGAVVSKDRPSCGAPANPTRPSSAPSVHFCRDSRPRAVKPALKFLHFVQLGWARWWHGL
jgi:hypothetical protein